MSVLLMEVSFLISCWLPDAKLALTEAEYPNLPPEAENAISWSYFLLEFTVDLSKVAFATNLAPMPIDVIA